MYVYVGLISASDNRFSFPLLEIYSTTHYYPCSIHNVLNLSVLKVPYHL